MAIPNEGQNAMPFLSNIGKSKKKIREGMTNQNTDCERAMIGLISLVSIYSQMIPRKETNGNEASIPPSSVKRFEISEIRTIMIAEMSVLRAKCIIYRLLSLSALS